MKDTAKACRNEAITFLPFAMETLGGLHPGAVATARQLAAALASVEESDPIWQSDPSLSDSCVSGSFHSVRQSEVLYEGRKQELHNQTIFSVF